MTNIIFQHLDLFLRALLLKYSHRYYTRTDVVSTVTVSLLGSDAVEFGRSSNFLRAHCPISSVVMPNAGFREQFEDNHETL